MRAATMRMMSVTSCSASHTNCRNVLGGLGGMTFDPNTSTRCFMSVSDPLNPENTKNNISSVFGARVFGIINFHKTMHINTTSRRDLRRENRFVRMFLCGSEFQQEKLRSHLHSEYCSKISSTCRERDPIWGICLQYSSFNVLMCKMMNIQPSERDRHLHLLAGLGNDKREGLVVTAK